MVWSCDEKIKYGDDRKATERKAQVNVDQQHQQQPPGGKERQPQRKEQYKKRTEWRKFFLITLTGVLVSLEFLTGE